MTGNGVSIYQLQKTEGEKSTQIAGEEKGTPGGFLPGNTLPVQTGHWKGPSPKSRPWSRWLLQSWKAYTDILVLLSGVVTHHCPPSRDCGDRQHPRDERTAMQMLCAYQRAGTRGGVGKSLSAGSEGDAKQKWAPSTVVRKKGQFWFRGEWCLSAETFMQETMGENLQIYLLQSLPSLQPTAVFADGEQKIMDSWIKCATACQNFKRYINTQWKDRQQAFEMKGKSQWNCETTLRIRIPH